MSTMPEATPPPFMSSLTCRALQSAFPEAAAARRLYRAAACKMEDAGLHVIAHALRFTAAQEQEHEAIFRGLLAVNDAPVPVHSEDIPPLPASPEELLARLIQSESDAAQRRCPSRARVASQEGYPRIAAAFRRIGETEAIHARRFSQYAQAFADGALFRDNQHVSWLCLGCGQLHAGCEAPLQCSSCGRSQGYFIRSNHYPFLVEG